MRHPKKIQTKSKKCQVSETNSQFRFEVKSPSGNTYSVSAYGDSWTCTCDWAKYRKQHDQRSGCSHVVAVEAYTQERSVSVWSNEDDAKRQKKTRFDLGDGLILTYS